MATYSSILAWRIPQMEEPGKLYSPRGFKESDTTEPIHFTSFQFALLFFLDSLCINRYFYFINFLYFYHSVQNIFQLFNFSFVHELFGSFLFHFQNCRNFLDNLLCCQLILFSFSQIKYSVVFHSFTLTDTYFMAHCKFYLENSKCGLSNYWVCPCMLSFQSCPTLLRHWAVARQTSLSMGVSRQEYWSGFPCPPPGDLPDPGLEPMSLMSHVLAGRFFTTSSNREAQLLSVSL